VIGETYRTLAQYGQLKDGNKLPYEMPFQVGMDLQKKESSQLTDGKIMGFINANVLDLRSYTEKDLKMLVERVEQYLRSKEYSAKTFEEYALPGAPSTILVDRKG